MKGMASNNLGTTLMAAIAVLKYVVITRITLLYCYYYILLYHPLEDSLQGSTFPDGSPSKD
jgi:hypothetical protein